MEDEQARQAAEDQVRQAATNVAASTERTADAADIDADEETLLQQAIAMSEGRDVDMGEEQGDDDEMDEEEAIARAIEMSMKQGQAEQKKQ
jgi:26S proteasome regulatory subunit N10